MSTLYADPAVLWARLLERVVIDEFGCWIFKGEVHRACCHETDDKPLGLIVCRFCWHEPSVAIPRRRRESAEAAA